MKILQKIKFFNKIPSDKKEGKSGDKIRYGRSNSLPYFGKFPERIFEIARSSRHIRNYTTPYLLVKEKDRKKG